MLISPKQHLSIHYYSILLFCLFLPLIPRLSTIFIGIMVINWLMSGDFALKFTKFKAQPLAILFSSFYIIYLIGLLYTSNMQEGLQDVETKLSLLLFPLILFTMPLSQEPKRDFVLKAFVLGCLLASVYSVGMATYIYLNSGENTFFYESLSSYLHLHPTYFACYLSFSLLSVLYYVTKQWHIYPRKKRIAAIFIVSSLMLVTLLLSARIVIITLGLTLSIAFLIYMYRTKRIVPGIGILLVSLIAFVGLIWSLPNTKKRMVAAIEPLYSQDSQYQPNIRLRIWSATSKLIANNFFIGNGTGDLQDELKKEYKRRNYVTALKKNLNTHNQYLQTALALGIIGLIILIANLLLPLIFSVQQGHFLYIYFLVLMIIPFMTEAMLETQQGVLFYAFFNSFLAEQLQLKRKRKG